MLHFQYKYIKVKSEKSNVGMCSNQDFKFRPILIVLMIKAVAAQ